MTTLTASLYDVSALELEPTPAGGLRVVRWYEDAFDAWGLGAPLFSLSMLVGDPVPDHVVTNFFDNLMPEVRRDQLAAAMAMEDSSLFALLGAVGRDCAGAISVTPTGTGADQRPGTTVPVTEQELATLVRDLPRRPLGVDAEVRHSLAGVQGKLLLVQRADGGWALPTNGHPSSYILKAEPLEFRFGFAGNELLCTRLARACGLTGVDSYAMSVAGRPLFVTSRFDRVVERSGAIQRIHQEDLCQVFGRSVGAKYEREGERLLARTAGLLLRYARRADVVRLARMVTFNVAIGNTDAHCKNVSILHRPDATIELAPIYDVAHLVMLGRSREPGMLICGRSDILAITGRDLVTEIERWRARINRRDAEQIVNDVLEDITINIVDVARDVWVDESIVEAILQRAEELRTSLR